MYEKIKKICNHLKKENENNDINNNIEIKEKFEIYKKWLIENGAIFDKNIDFPFVFGPFHKIGCKSITKINENEAIILIPRNLLIISEDLHFIDKYINNILDEISDEDIPIIYLSLYLFLEKQNSNSFYKPFIDIIFLKGNKTDFYDKWNEKTLNELNDEICMESFKKRLNNLEELYNLIIQCEQFSKMTKNDFANCYFQVISRKIDLKDDNNISVLVPLLDLIFQDNSIKIKYEIYDSENMVFKYASIINDYNNSKINLYMTTSNHLPTNKPSYNKLIPFIENNNDDNSEDSDNEKKIININNNDYFSIALSKNEKILENFAVCGNQYPLCNKKLLKNKGYCLLYNENDYITFKFNFNRGELLIDKYLENIFGDSYQTRNDDPIYNCLKLKIEFNNISTDLLKYYRFMHFFKDKKNPKEFFKYHFDIELEIKIINSSIDFLKEKLKYMGINYSFENDFKELENIIYTKKENNYFKGNLLIFRISQKIILKNQIDLLLYILKIMNKFKNNIYGYNNIFDYIEKEKYINQYDKEENTRMKILRFIAYMSKNIDLN